MGRGPNDLLIRIKRAVLSQHFVFSIKARREMDTDGLTELEVLESIINAFGIYKTIRSKDPRTGRREYLHIIIGSTLQGLAIYTKGKLVSEAGEDTYYFLVSSKRCQ